MSESREDCVYLAKLAEQAERYEGAVLRVSLVFACLPVPLRDGREHEARSFL
jgi:hypothetical protein